ncbi:MAG: hypothetical protein M3044_23200 [Thermoproteota archaeon]|nr:hypothetical protein [Thermoproteota archaeon]
MEKYPNITNFDRSVLARVLAGVGMMTVLAFGSWCVIGSTYAVSSSLSPPTNLPSIKITSPPKGQQVPVDSSILVSGISSPPAAEKTPTDCKVSVLLNEVKPYQKAVATGHGGTNDYSTWRYAITSNYAAIKQGQNKITAKISCAANPTNLTKFNSLNVTGIGTSHSVNGQNGKNGSNGANGISSGGNGGSANGGNGGSANGGIGGSGGNGGNGGSAVAGKGGSAIGGNGGAGGNGGNGGNAIGGN